MMAIQSNKTGFHVLTHEKRAGELDHAILAGANLQGAKMNGASAAVADFRDADLSNAMMNGARLCRANLDGANLSNAQLSRADLSGASLRNAVVSGANIDEAVVTGAEMADMMRAPPTKVFVDDQPLETVIRDHELWCESGGLQGATHRLAGVDFRAMPSLAGRQLTALRAPGAIMFGLNLQGAHLEGCDLSGADLPNGTTCAWPIYGSQADPAVLQADMRGRQSSRSFPVTDSRLHARRPDSRQPALRRPAPRRSAPRAARLRPTSNAPSSTAPIWKAPSSIPRPRPPTPVLTKC